MNNAYEYDVEIYPNLFEVTFIPKQQTKNLSTFIKLLI